MDVPETRQEIRNQHIGPEELQVEPETVRQYDVGNKFERRLSYLVAHDGSRFHLLRCEPDGILKVYAQPAVFTYYAVQRALLDGSETTEVKIESDKYFSRIDIYVFDEAVLMELGTEPLQLYGDPVKLPAGYYSFDYLTKKVRLTLPEGGSPTEVQLVVWY